MPHIYNEHKDNVTNNTKNYHVSKQINNHVHYSYLNLLF